MGGASVCEEEGSVGDQSFNSQSNQKAFCQTVATQPATLFDGLVGMVVEMNDFQQYIETGNDLCKLTYLMM